MRNVVDANLSDRREVSCGSKPAVTRGSVHAFQLVSWTPMNGLKMAGAAEA